MQGLESVQSFIFGVDRIPLWFESCKYVLIDGGKIGCYIESKGVTYKALVGDVVFRNAHGDVFTLAKEPSKRYYYTEWKANMVFRQRELVVYQSLVYEVLEDIESTTEKDNPSNNTKLYKLRSELEVSRGDKLTYELGMSCREGNVYVYDGHSFVCKRDMSPCLDKPSMQSSNWELIKEV